MAVLYPGQGQDPTTTDPGQIDPIPAASSVPNANSAAFIAWCQATGQDPNTPGLYQQWVSQGMPAGPGAAPAPNDSVTPAPAAPTTGLIGSLTATPPPALPTTVPLPNYTPPPPFQAPSVADALAQPGYQFTLGQGENAIQNWAAAKGTLNSSGTANALTDYAENAAQADYQTVYDNMLQAYNTNYQTQYTDPQAIAFQRAQAQQQQGNTSYQDAYSAWLASLGLTQTQIQDLLAANSGTTVNFAA